LALWHIAAALDWLRCLSSCLSRQWVYNNFIKATSATADKLLDLAQAWPDDHVADYVQELNWKEYRSRLLIADAAQLGMNLELGM
jgi:hypothetical protein